jgi:hypothetical protein
MVRVERRRLVRASVAAMRKLLSAYSPNGVATLSLLRALVAIALASNGHNGRNFSSELVFLTGLRGNQTRRMLWMRDGIVLREQVAARNIQVSPVNEPIVALHEGGSVSPIIGRQIEPGYGWCSMVRHVQVVVEKHEAKQWRLLHDRGAMCRIGRRPMLRE